MNGIHPLIQFLLSEGGFDKDRHHWPTLAEQFDIVTGEAAFGRWKRFLGSDRGLEFKKSTLDKNGNVVSTTIGRAAEPKDIPEGGEVVFVTSTPNGGAFVRREFKKQGKPPITDEEREAIEKMVSERPITAPYSNSHQTYLVIGCVHRPYHDKKIWSSLISFIADNRDSLHGIVINGDYLDMKSLSSHDEKKVIPEGIDLGVEYRDGFEGIMELKAAFGGRWRSLFKHYNYGNHEARYFKHIGQFDHSRYGTALMSPHEALKLEENGFSVQLDWENGRVLIGSDLEVFHGVFTGPTAMKKHIERSDRNAIFSHTHAMGEFKQGGRTAYNIGWLGDETSAGFSYANRFMFSGWQKGFALVNVMDDGRTIVNRVLCDNGFFVGSKRY